ncbi:MAG: cysteine synthase [Candidatus Woesearchaeota archaeon]|nr:cysteine synthase [Candidatus Woesearchaeota archaeon]
MKMNKMRNSGVLNSILDAIGNTPLVRLKRLSTGNVFVKAEHLNPGGSIKDRVAKYIIKRAIEDGKLKQGMTIIEATSGNTGIGLSLVGRQLGYRVICVMPENMSIERRKIIKAFGGEIVITPAEENIAGSVSKVKEIISENPEAYFFVNQFSNPLNAEVHYKETAQEIFNAMQGKIDVFVAGIGSGGTLQGIGTFLKEKNPKIRIVAVEPKNSASLLGREPGLHQINGIGDGFVPDIIDRDMIDAVITVSDDEAIETTRRLASEEGMLVGTSSGANVFAALQLDNGKSNIVSVLPDRAERYFSSGLF